MESPGGRAPRGRLGRSFWRLGLALLPAALFGLYARYPALALISYWVLVPWILLYADDRHERVPIAYYVAGAYASWVLLYFGTSTSGWFVPFAMAVYVAPSWIPFGPALRRAHRLWRLPRTLTVPVLWAACEWLRYEIALAHIDLYALGYSQARFPALVQVADVTGVYGVSFLVAAVNGLVADLLFALRDRKGSVGAVFRSRRIVWSVSGVAVAFLAVAAYGWFRLTTARETEGPTVALVQPNVTHAMRRVHGMHLSQVMFTEREVPAGAADLIVWPEYAILDYIGSDRVYLEDLGWLSRRKGAPLLVGAIERSETIPGKGHNVAILVDQEGRILGEGRKRLLFPWTEYLPLDGFLGWVCPPLQRFQRALIRKAWDTLGTGIPGERAELLRLPWRNGDLPFGVVLCHEHIYPPIASETARLGPRFIVNPTSEGTVGGPMQEQMLRISMLRAIENRVAYVRCGNAGISAIVDAQGRRRSILRGERGRTILDAGVLVDKVPLSPGRVTLYARSRDAFAKGLVLLSAAMLVPLGRTGRTKRGLAGLLGVSLLGLMVACGIPSAPGDDPTRAPQALDTGRRLFAEKRCREALPALAAACAAAPACREALPYTADCYQALEEPEAAVMFFREVAARHGDLAAESTEYEGYFLQKAGYIPEAEKAFEEALRLRPSARAWVLLGKLRLRGLGDVAGSLDAFERALRLDPRDVEARHMKGRAQCALGDFEGARRTLEELLADEPLHVYAWAVLGRAKELLGDEPGAREAWLRAADLDGRHVEARFMLARVAMREGRLEEAERWRREVMAIEETLGPGPRE